MVFSVATKASLDECDVDDTSQECLEYAEKLEELQAIIKEHKPAMAAIEAAAKEVKKIKLPEPKAESDSQNNDKLKEAVAYAKKVTAEQGFYCSAAALAWEAVEGRFCSK